MVAIFTQVDITLVVWIRRGDCPSLLHRHFTELLNPRYSIQRHARKINGRVFGEQAMLVECREAERSHSRELQVSPAIPIPLCHTGSPGSM
jgi:hypothetical protein